MVLLWLHDQHHSIDKAADDGCITGCHHRGTIDQDLVVVRFGPGNDIWKTWRAERLGRIGGAGTTGKDIQIAERACIDCRSACGVDVFG